MFHLMCLKCFQQLDIQAFRDGKLSACPNCGTLAFGEELAPPVTKVKSTDKEQMFRFMCPHCRRTLKTKTTNCGKTVKCLACNTPILIPVPEEPMQEANKIDFLFSPLQEENFLFPLLQEENNESTLNSLYPKNEEFPEEGAKLFVPLYGNIPKPPPINNISEKIVISLNDILTTPTTVPTYRTEHIFSKQPKNIHVQKQTNIAFDYPKPPVGGKLPVRQRRLYADVKAVAEQLARSPYIKIQSVEGNPPDLYFIEYHIRGIENICGNDVIYRNNHVVEIRLTADYPRLSPVCKLLTPIFHPNFEPSHICIGDYWAAGEKLVDLIIRIGEMIAYQSYNIKSPLDGEAAMWADQHEFLLPTDKSDLRPPE